MSSVPWFDVRGSMLYQQAVFTLERKKALHPSATQTQSELIDLIALYYALCRHRVKTWRMYGITEEVLTIFIRYNVTQENTSLLNYHNYRDLKSLFQYRPTVQS